MVQSEQSVSSVVNLLESESLFREFRVFRGQLLLNSDSLQGEIDNGQTKYFVIETNLAIKPFV